MVRCSISNVCCGGSCVPASSSITSTPFTTDGAVLFIREGCGGFVGDGGEFDGKTRCISSEVHVTIESNLFDLSNCGATVNDVPCDSCTICSDVVTVSSIGLDFVTAQCSDFQLDDDPQAMECDGLHAFFEDALSSGPIRTARRTCATEALSEIGQESKIIQKVELVALEAAGDGGNNSATAAWTSWLTIARSRCIDGIMAMDI